MARPLLSSIVALSTAAILSTAFSCKTFDLPAETCNPSSLQSSRQDRPDCSRCLEDHCCDAVGVCQNTGGCARIVSDTQDCILGSGLKGAGLEKQCAESSGLSDLGTDQNVQHPEADSAYRCMRSNCGAQCGLPVCQVDKAAPLIRNAQCDDCFSGGCCPQLNSCYDNRACKLMLDCIIDTCGGALGTSLEEGAPDHAVVSKDQIAALCEVPAKVPPGMPECVRSCLCRYNANDQGLPPTDPALLPVNLARAVYACGKDASCGDACSRGPDDAGHD